MTVNSTVGFTSEKQWLPVSITITQTQAKYAHNVSVFLSAKYEPIPLQPESLCIIIPSRLWVNWQFWQFPTMSGPGPDTWFNQEY